MSRSLKVITLNTKCRIAFILNLFNQLLPKASAFDTGIAGTFVLVPERGQIARWRALGFRALLA